MVGLLYRAVGVSRFCRLGFKRPAREGAEIRFAGSNYLKDFEKRSGLRFRYSSRQIDKSALLRG